MRAPFIMHPIMGQALQGHGAQFCFRFTELSNVSRLRHCGWNGQGSVSAISRESFVGTACFVIHPSDGHPFWGFLIVLLLPAHHAAALRGKTSIYHKVKIDPGSPLCMGNHPPPYFEKPHMRPIRGHWTEVVEQSSPRSPVSSMLRLSQSKLPG